MLLRLLFRATHTMNAEMARGIRSRGWDAFQPSFTALLSHLDTEGTTVSTLASRLGTSRQATSQLARVIEQAGFIERLPHPSDGRSVLLRHTESGRRILLDALDVMTSIETDYAKLTTPHDIAELKRQLTALLDHIDPRGGLIPE
jgi:DNA-binding MarR family transcriptional regulator